MAQGTSCCKIHRTIFFLFVYTVRSGKSGAKLNDINGPRRKQKKERKKNEGEKKQQVNGKNHQFCVKAYDEIEKYTKK